MPFVDQEPRRLIPGHEFARTYSSRVYDDPWMAVEDYQQVQQLASEYDNPSGTAIANSLNLPPGRVKPWLGGSKPNCVRGLEVAQKHDWIDVFTDSDVFRGLNVLVAWIHASGSISTDTYSPYFVVNVESDMEILTTAAELANTELRETRSGKNGQIQELRPPEAAAVIGRTLSVLGAPVGRKDREAVNGVPDYLAHVDEIIVREFIQTYIHKRGKIQRDDDLVLPRDRRNEGFLPSITRLARRLTGEEVTINEKHMRCSAASTSVIEGWPPLLGIRDI